MESRAESRFVRVSPQKARLVVDLIRGRQAGEALELLAVTRKRIAHEVAKVLRSAIANATQKDDQLDVDDLQVVRAYVNDGPRQKRIRPAPMGRAYRYQRRLAHIAVHVADRAQPSLRQEVEPPAAAAPAAAPLPARRKPAPPARPRKSAAKPAARKAAPKRKAAAAPKPKTAAKPKAGAAKPRRGGAASKPGNKSGGGKSGS